jgi:hypothetical protein
LHGVRQPAAINPFRGVFNYGVNRMVTSSSQGDSINRPVQAPLLKLVSDIELSISPPTLDRKRVNPVRNRTRHGRRGCCGGIHRAVNLRDRTRSAGHEVGSYKAQVGRRHDDGRAPGVRRRGRARRSEDYTGAGSRRVTSELMRSANGEKSAGARRSLRARRCPATPFS